MFRNGNHNKREGHDRVDGREKGSEIHTPPQGSQPRFIVREKICEICEICG